MAIPLMTKRSEALLMAISRMTKRSEALLMALSRMTKSSHPGYEIGKPRTMLGRFAASLYNDG
jgi:hypothetical protein